MITCQLQHRSKSLWNKDLGSVWFRKLWKSPLAETGWRRTASLVHAVEPTYRSCSCLVLFFVQTLVISHLFFVNALHINQCFPMWGAMPLIGHSYCWVVFTYSEKNASFVISFFFVCWPVVYLVHDFVSVSKTQVYELTFVFYLMFSSRKWTAATRWPVPHASNISVGCAWALSAKSTHMVTLMIHAPPVTTSEWNIST